MASSRPPNLLLFCITAALLALAAFAFSGDAHNELGATRSGPARHIAAQSGPRRLHGATRHFLTAFLRYEVGDLSRSVRRQLRRSADAGFAAQLLARPLPDVHASSPRAQISRLRIVVLSRVPGRALVSGSALRRRRPEQFSFLFEARRGAWRAIGPGE